VKRVIKTKFLSYLKKYMYMLCYLFIYLFIQKLHVLFYEIGLISTLHLLHIVIKFGRYLF
jgi:hypothetical protein